MIKVVRAKLHGITITGAELHYHGSITLDPEVCEQAGIFPMEFVEIWNKDSGARISTYVIYGEPGSRCCILNGAAARTCQKGDQVIICASDYIQPKELYQLRPTVLTFTPDNQVDEVMHYEVRETAERQHDFRIVREGSQQGTTRSLQQVDVEALSTELRSRGLDDRAIADILSKHLSQFSH
ncbi:aspartate 1-decarboxylase [Leeia sp.]|uniref:aspartate 1-decarboxylase n=1 Tax=Leeia sp. TaxID=2884678 RepID=UPI0035AEB783